ncbi:MAG: hypothetical protein ACYC25_17615 [Paludibacter sp.]
MFCKGIYLYTIFKYSCGISYRWVTVPGGGDSDGFTSIGSRLWGVACSCQLFDAGLSIN